MRTFVKTATIAMASSATTALLFAACTVENTSSRPVTGPPVAVQTANAHAAPTSPNPAVAVYQQNGGSVVNITSLAIVPTRQGQAVQPQGVGSGCILDTDGRIVTNNHVVQDADQLAVTFQDKTTVPAKLVGRDPDNDLAVIQVDPNATDDQGNAVANRIKPVTLGDSDQIAIGDTAIAMGSPLGLQQTVTEGIVSALRNPGDESPLPGQQLDLLGGAIQTDAAINPGNSGGPLFNADGLVIGVDSAILSQSGGNEGIGFAIPINVVKRVVPELIQNGYYRHPLLGVTTIPLSQIGPAARQQLGLAASQHGLLVVNASDGAQQAGIRAASGQITLGGQRIPTGGDVIVAVDGHSVSTGGDLRAYIENTRHPGDTVTLSVLRDGQHLDIPVTLGERPQQPQLQPAG